MKKLRKLACVLALILVLVIPTPAVSVVGLGGGEYYVPGSPMINEKAYISPTEGDDLSHWVSTAPTIGNYDYSFSVMGDIQIVNNYFPDYLPSMFDYVVDNAEARNTKFCFNMGDITDKDKIYEWEAAKAGYDRIAKKMPYVVVRGNHDGRDNMNKYFGGNSAYMNMVDGSYMGKSYMTYQTFSVGIHKYLVLSLDWFVDEIHLKWANDVISAHPDYNAIVCVHCFLGKSETPTVAGESGTQSKYTYNLDVNNTPYEQNPSLDGNDIWNALKGNKNLKLIMGGHISYDDVGRWQGTGTNGNIVQGLLVCPQDIDVALARTAGDWHFQTTDPAYTSGMTGGYYAKPAAIMTTLYVSNSGRFFVEHYSVTRNQWWKSKNQFSFNLDLISINDNPTGSLYTPVIGM
ncbi:MAG: metallophosphoesterase [Clostridia bacterium]|nr:metallophosphoesterase [Clostridia bacterium]